MFFESFWIVLNTEIEDLNLVTPPHPSSQQQRLWHRIAKLKKASRDFGFGRLYNHDVAATQKPTAWLAITSACLAAWLKDDA